VTGQRSEKKGQKGDFQSSRTTLKRGRVNSKVREKGQFLYAQTETMRARSSGQVREEEAMVFLSMRRLMTIDLCREIADTKEPEEITPDKRYGDEGSKRAVWAQPEWGRMKRGSEL